MEQGRIKILCDIVPTGNEQEDRKIIPRIIELTRDMHNKNVADMTRLKDYYYNKTAILGKDKKQQPEINNKIDIDYPAIAVTTINAYCFANPLTFSARTTGKEDQIKAFIDALDDDNYSSKSHDMYLNSGITSLGYRYIIPANEEEIKNGIFFKTICDLSPLNTYCVYSNDLRKDKICAITFYKKKEYDQKTLKQKGETTFYTVFTKYHKWELYQSGGQWRFLTTNILLNGKFSKIEAYPLTYKMIPIVENVRKNDRTGDFEQALALVDAINVLASSRLDAVQQSVDYLLCLRDIDIWSEGALARVKEAVAQGILGFKSIEGATVQPTVDVLDIKLNQSEVQTLQDFLCEKLEEVLNIPNRETRSSGGDTGSAVESRNGFRSLENIAGLVTTNAMKTENETLEIILAMCKNISSCPFKDLKPKDIQIKDNRNRVENLATATSAYSTLKSAGMNDTDALIVSRLVADAPAVANRNEQYAKKQEEKQQKANENKVAENNVENKTQPENGTTSK